MIKQYKKAVGKITAYFAAKKNIPKDSEEFAEFQKEIDAIIFDSLNTLLLFILALLFKIFPFVLLYFLSSGMLRKVSHGFHAQKRLICTIAGLSNFLGGTALALNFVLPPYLGLILWIICAIVFYCFAPATTKKSPLFPHQKKLLRNISLLMISFLGIVVMVLYFLNQATYANVLLFALLFHSIGLLPIIFKIFKS